MKKYLPILFGWLVFFAITAPAFPALARGLHRKPSPVPAPVPPPVVIPSSTLQLGFFQAPVPVLWNMEFTDASFPSASGDLVIFLEPPDTDAQIVSGKFDAQLKAFSAAAKLHQGQIILALGEEVNCDNSDPWGGAYKGNTVASTIAAFQHEATLVRSIAPNVKIAFSANNDSCYGQPSASAYYPGSAYVDLIGDDGFDFGGQTWDSVFDHALSPLAAFNKPLWILSEGVTTRDNQLQFVKDTFTGAAKYNVQGVMYFSQNPFVLNSTALKSL
jgi:hypothetical protein